MKSSSFKFIRYGKLKAVKQKGFSSSDSFHSPPAGRGFYAFPYGFEEIFLVGATEATQPKVIGCLPIVTKYERSLWYNHTTKEYHDHTYEYTSRDIWRQKRVFTLKKDDLIWHHLKGSTKQSDILEESKSWILTTVEVWKKALNKEVSYNKLRTWKDSGKGNLRDYGSNGYYSKDHLEVFITKKKI